MHSWFRLSALAVVVLAPVALSSQEMTPPKWMVVVREVVKPGKANAHGKHEVAWARALEAGKYPAGSLGLQAMSGPNEMWWLTGFASAAEIQKLSETVSASPALTAVDQKYVPPETDFLTNSFTMIARLRDDISYDAGVPITSMRYMQVTRLVVKIGHGDEFTEARKLVKAAHEQIRATDGYAIYAVTAGAPTGTYLILAGKKSMADFDTDPHGAPYTAALGGPDGQKRLTAMTMSFQNTADTNLFQINSEISVLGKAWRDSEPYWKRKVATK